MDKTEMIFSSTKPRKLFFVLDMANNHKGSLEHGLSIIRGMHKATKEFNFLVGIKFQYRSLDTFIHPDYKKRMDIKYVKRFTETALSLADYKKMKDEMEKLGFVSVCTPYDERSVDAIEEQGFDIIKIASCSFTDWPLLERIAKTDKPIIASTAGASFEEIDNVVAFLSNRCKRFSIMHCVGEYPTPNANLHLNRISLLKERYGDLVVGFSTHEEPGNTDAVKIALAKGATIFERHVDVSEDRNAYSSSPEQVAAWMRACQSAVEISGEKNKPVNPVEVSTLRALGRGVFAGKDLKKGTRLAAADVFYAIPTVDKQVLANDTSKYMVYTLKKDLKKNEPVLCEQVTCVNTRAEVLAIAMKVKDLLKKSSIPISKNVSLEISHHYGIERFYEFGATIINVINREYCKKYIIMLPNQKHPTHFHKQKEESFIVVYGDLTLKVDDEVKTYGVGDIVLLKREAPHSFSSEHGGIFEEISTTHIVGDSYYDDQKICENQDRKTVVRLWLN